MSFLQYILCFSTLSIVIACPPPPPQNCPIPCHISNTCNDHISSSSNYQCIDGCCKRRPEWNPIEPEGGLKWNEGPIPIRDDSSLGQSNGKKCWSNRDCELYESCVQDFGCIRTSPRSWKLALNFCHIKWYLQNKMHCFCLFSRWLAK